MGPFGKPPGIASISSVFETNLALSAVRGCRKGTFGWRLEGMSHLANLGHLSPGNPCVCTRLISGLWRGYPIAILGGSHSLQRTFLLTRLGRVEAESERGRSSWVGDYYQMSDVDQRGFDMTLSQVGVRLAIPMVVHERSH